MNDVLLFMGPKSAMVNALTCNGGKIVDYIQRRTKCRVVSVVNQKEVEPYKTDGILFIMCGFFGWCKWRDRFMEWVRLNDTIVWVSDDPTRAIPTQIRKEAKGTLRVWSTFALHNTGLGPFTEVRRVPWNQMNWKPGMSRAKSVFHGCFYYGYWRATRYDLLTHYFSGDGDYLVHVASKSQAQLDKFMALNAMVIEHLQPETYEFFQRFQFSLYLEDIKNNPRHLNNRFFELLSAHVPMLFDGHTVLTLENEGLPLPDEDMVVHKPEDIARIARDANFDRMALRQQELWAISNHYHDDLLRSFKGAYHEIRCPRDAKV